jgi:PAS domain S-box-containing protein
MDTRINNTAYITMLDTAASGILIFDSDLTVIYANSKIKEITGYETGQITGTSFFDLIVPDDKYLKIAMVKLESCLLKPFNDLDLNIKKKTGEDHAIHVMGSSFEDGGKQYTVLFIEDITSRRALEKVMESSYDKFIQTTLDLDAALRKIKEQRKELELYQERMKKELKVANSVQRSIIPQSFPSVKNMDIWAFSSSSAELGGDYFDFVEFPDNRVGVILADISGHGVPAALITTMLKVQFSNLSKLYPEPEEFLFQLNNEMHKSLGGTGFYLTANYALINLLKMTISYCNAAHEFALYYSPLEEKIVEFGQEENRGTVIGSFENAEYPSEVFSLTKGGKLLFFTDGLTEAKSKEGNYFGKERLKAFLTENHHLPGREFSEKLLKEINAFCQTKEQSDDRTLVIIDVLEGSKKSTPSEADIKNKIDNAFQEGRKYLKKKDYEKAVESFLTILEYDQNSFGAYSYLGQIFCITENYEESKKYFKKSLDINPDYYQGYYYLGIVLYKIGEYEDAKECWIKLKERAGDFKRVNEYIALLKKKGF